MTVAEILEIAEMLIHHGADNMQTMSAKDAENSFGLLLDRA